MNRAPCLLALLVCAAAAGCATRSAPDDMSAGAAAARPAASVAVPPDLPASDVASWLQGERARISRARGVAQQQFQDAEMACWRRFAVNDCVRRARVERRATLDGLRQQELQLNTLERERRTAGRLRQLEQKQQKAAP
jgi:hypothetical protein